MSTVLCRKWRRCCSYSSRDEGRPGQDYRGEEQTDPEIEQVARLRRRYIQCVSEPVKIIAVDDVGILSLGGQLNPVGNVDNSASTLWVRFTAAFHENPLGARASNKLVTLRKGNLELTIATILGQRARFKFRDRAPVHIVFIKREVF